MTDFTTLIRRLHDHFSEPTPQVRAYLAAYEERARRQDQTAFRAVLTAWRELTEDERLEIGRIVDAR